MRPRSILAVCSGNTCRSPMAEAIARSLLGNSTLVESAGLDALEGKCANKKAVTVMKEMGLDIEAHRTRNIGSVDANTFDMVVAMCPSIARKLAELGVDEYRSTAKQIASQLKTLFGVLPDV